MTPFRIDPNLSAMENLWEAAHQAVVVVVCSGQRRRHLKFTKEEWDDLLFRATFETILCFMRKIRKTGKVTMQPYDRSKSFFQNVYACAWSVSGHCIEELIDEIRFKLNVKSIDASSNPGMDKAPKIVETLDTKCYLNYYRQTDKFKELRPYNKLTSQHLKDKRAHEEYKAYVAECELLGVEPMEEFKWRGRNNFIRAYVHKPGTRTLKEMRRSRERGRRISKNHK